MELSLEPFAISYASQFSASAYLGGFYEMAFAPEMTVLWKAGCHNVFEKGFPIEGRYPSAGTTSTDYSYHASSDYSYQYHTRLLLGAEPRWYFSFKNRYPLGKAHLNAGFYVGLPITIEYALYKSRQNEIELHLLPTVGYRQSIGLRSLVELSAGVGSYCYTHSATAWKPRFDYRIQASYAYTF